MDRAEEFYKRAVEADPQNHLAIVSYATFALANGRYDGHQLLDRVPRAGMPSRFAARFHFLRYAHAPEEAVSALAELKSLLPVADPAPYVDLSDNIARAEIDGHPDLQLLRGLARVLRGEAKIDILDQHSTWRAVAAKPDPAVNPKTSPRKKKKPRG